MTSSMIEFGFFRIKRHFESGTKAKKLLKKKCTQRALMGEFAMLTSVCRRGKKT